LLTIPWDLRPTIGRCAVDRDYLTWLTQEVGRLHRNLDSLRAEMATQLAAPKKDAATFRQLLLRIEDAMAQLQQLHADLAAWNTTQPTRPRKAPPRPPSRERPNRSRDA
jgi:hypothetical protein